MKKLNLQLGSIKEMLTKEQMKKVAGGYDSMGNNGYTCTFTYVIPPGPSDACIYAHSADGAQNLADRLCLADDNCTDVDCGTSPSNC